MNEIRVALIGCGRQAERHSKYFGSMGDGVRVVATADTDLDRARRIAERHGCSWHSDYREVLERPDVNTVVIILPHALLAGAAIAAAKAGKQILCEKPMAINVRQGEEVVGAADAAGVKLMISGQHRYRTVVKTMQQLIAAGEIGRPYLIEEVRKTPGFGPGYPTWYRKMELAGGGVLQNSTSHSLDLVRFIMQREIAGVSAMLGRYVHDIEGEDSGILMLRLDDGSIGVTIQSWKAHGCRVEVTGTGGQLKIEIDNVLYVNKGAGWKEIMRTPEGEDEREELDRYFVRCLREDLPPSPGGYEYMGVVRAIEAAYRSAEVKREVSTADL